MTQNEKLQMFKHRPIPAITAQFHPSIRGVGVSHERERHGPHDQNYSSNDAIPHHLCMS